MRAPAGIELLTDGTWNCGSTGGEWSPGGCGCGSGGSCGCGGSCGGCGGEGGCGGKPSTGEAPRLADYDGEIWASPVRATIDRSSSGQATPCTPGFCYVGGVRRDGFLKPPNLVCSGPDCLECETCQTTTASTPVPWTPPTPQPQPPDRKGRCPCIQVLAECQWAIMDMPEGGEACERQRKVASHACLRYAVCLTEVDNIEDLRECPPVPPVPGCPSCETLLDRCLRAGTPPGLCGHEYVKCMGCAGRPTASDSTACNYPDNYCYAGALAGCFCRCAGDTPWAQEVRGCLRCLYNAGVDPGLAHAACYDSATAQGMDAPEATLAWCYAKCASPKCISISTDITDWQVWGWR